MKIPSILSPANIRGLLALLIVGAVMAALAWFSVTRREKEITPQETVVTKDSLHIFDPNIVDFKTLRAMGVESRVATSLLKYRAAGKIFRIPEDVATCYGMTDSVYFALEPYIEIGQEFRIKPKPKITKKPTAVAVKDSVPKYTPKPRRTEPLELNSADSAMLRTVYGIGPKTAGAIVKYREKRGPFRSVDELRRLRVITDENFEYIRTQIWVDSTKI